MATKKLNIALHPGADNPNKSLYTILQPALDTSKITQDMVRPTGTAFNPNQDLMRAKLAYDNLGTPPAGWNAVDYKNFKTANPNLEPNAEDLWRNNNAPNTNTFSWEFTSGTNIVFKINGTTVATHTTNLPSTNSTDFEFSFGIATATNSARTLQMFRRVPFLMKQV